MDSANDSKTIGISYVWIFLIPNKNIFGYKNIRIRASADETKQDFKSCLFPHRASEDCLAESILSGDGISFYLVS